MIVQLAIQAAFEFPAPEPIHQLSHRLPSLKMSPTAPAKACPAIFFGGELLAPRSRQGIELRLAPGFRLLPFAAKPSLLLQSVQRRIERALVHLNHGPRDLFQPLGNAIAVRRLQR